MKNSKDLSSHVGEQSVSQEIVQWLERIGVRCAFGVSGGAMANNWIALSHSEKIKTIHCRHEGGAAFAAVEHYFATGNPGLVFVTTGPGIANALNGLYAAKAEGAKVILLSAYTSPHRRGKNTIQESSSWTMPSSGILEVSPLFDFATLLESPLQLQSTLIKLGNLLAYRKSVVAHLCIPTGVQGQTSPSLEFKSNALCDSLPAENVMKEIVAKLSTESFVVIVGHGVREATEELAEFIKISNALVISTPRGKGLFSEKNSRYLGMSGLAGFGSIREHFLEKKPKRLLVLGSKLGEGSTLYSEDLLPEIEIIHVDYNEEVFGVTFPQRPTVGVKSSIAPFLRSMISLWPELKSASASHTSQKCLVSLPHLSADSNILIRPQFVMQCLQEVFIDEAPEDCVVWGEPGNSLLWSAHYLRLRPGRQYRTSLLWGSMGHATAGILGACTSKQRGIAVVGDGAMLMNNEINTAVQHGIPAIWIVLNDSSYNMCHQGLQALKAEGPDASISPTNFSLFAESMGAVGIRVEKESHLLEAMRFVAKKKIAAVIDIVIDPKIQAPSDARNHGLARDAANSGFGADKT